MQMVSVDNWFPLKVLVISLNDKLVFSKAMGDKLFAFKFYRDKIQTIEFCDSNNIVGNIYVGVVAETVKNINAAFVNFDNGRKGYYLLNDNQPIFLNKKNTDKVCQGDRVLVQVISDRVKTKEYTLSSNITFTGKYVVFTVGRTGVSISKKIRDTEIRERLRNHFMALKNEEYGFILRTSCMDVSLEVIQKEAEELMEQWEKVKEKARHLTACSVVVKSSSDAVKISKEACNKGVEEIITDEKDVYLELTADENIRNNCHVTLYEEDFSLSKLYSLEKILQDSLSKKVWLKSGAYLVIEHTEALHVIDVNTGKSVKKNNREDNFFAINMEAAAAIALEIRKRNLSGIIIVDFINMKKEEYNKKIVEEMKRLVSSDEITTNVAGLTNLGLMEITRKRVKKALYELLD